MIGHNSHGIITRMGPRGTKIMGLDIYTLVTGLLELSHVAGGETRSCLADGLLLLRCGIQHWRALSYMLDPHGGGKQEGA
jgi:hypothetical protein